MRWEQLVETTCLIAKRCPVIFHNQRQSFDFCWNIVALRLPIQATTLPLVAGTR